MSQDATEMLVLRAQVESLAAQVVALTERVDAMQGGTMPRRDATGAITVPPERKGLWRATEDIAQRAREQSVRGLAASKGCYTDTGDREYRWNREMTAEMLLAQDDERVARVLAVLGNKQRLALLKAVLDKPGSATELVERTGLTSSGQAYHHLNTLVTAGLIHSTERGQFAFVGHQAPAFLMLLMGVWHMLSTQWGTGIWDEPGKADERD